MPRAAKTPTNGVSNPEISIFQFWPLIDGKSIGYYVNLGNNTAEKWSEVDLTGTSQTDQKPSQKAHWAIVGGGMLGLATAWRLAVQGEKVTVLEASPELGGLTSAWSMGDTSWDRFYHVTLLSDTRLRALLEEIGLEKEIRWVQTRTGFFSGGKLYSLSSTVDFLKFPPLSLWQKFRLGSTIFYASKLRNWRSLERIPVELWLRKLSGNRTFEKIWLPLLKAKLGEAYQRTSAAFIWSCIDRMYKARRSGMKREMFGYVPGGYRRILQVLGEALEARGAIISKSSPVTKVVRDEATNQLHITCGASANQRIEKFDRVIMTTPSPIIDSACNQLNDHERRRLNSAEYIGVVCTSLLLDRPLAGYYVTNIIDTWVPLTGIIEMGAIVDPKFLNGHYLVYLPRYLMASDAGLDEPDDSIHERCLTTLERMYPDFNRSQVSAIQTARARHVMALPTLKYSEHLPPVVSSVPGLYLLNSAQVTIGTLNVNETIGVVERELAQTVLPDSQAKMHQSAVGRVPSPDQLVSL